MNVEGRSAVNAEGRSIVNAESRSTANTESRSTANTERRSTDVRSWMAQSFRQIDLLDLIKYIQTHRNFSVHQRSSSSSSVHLHQYKNQTVFKAIYYRGDEATQSVKEADSVAIDLAGACWCCK